MKKNICMKIMRLLVVLSVLVMNLSFSTVASATEKSHIDNQIASFEPISENSEINREEALEILGMTEEELGTAQLYVAYMPVTINSTKSTKVLSAGDVVALGQFSFTGSNVGSTLLAFNNATQAKFGVKWKWDNPQSRTNAILTVKLTNGLGNSFIQGSGATGYGDGEYHSFNSDMGSVSSAYSYHFVYETRFGYWEESFPTIKATVAVVIAAH